MLSRADLICGYDLRTCADTHKRQAVSLWLILATCRKAIEPGGILTGTFFQKIVLTRCGCAAGCARNEPTGMPLKYAIKNQGCLKLFENQSGMARSAIPEFEGAF
jgi:hypothetical protein